MTTETPKKTRAISIDLPELAESIDKFCAAHPLVNKSVLRHMVRKEVTRNALECVKDIETLAKGGI
jgi:hypothetical protein